ncbi:hypothetical protein BV22DRAFT_1119960 [Leucogyrophana mollusca]|uniref:Uncharacterized protein n=1 Tax=Leucogyrophana mollusca TaxID=85980 RepID=A0ACB8BGU4_9AGAM|nr:hypothetical protein BV22DRAFT_1119960 [Leucogyrophana mollusca]
MTWSLATLLRRLLGWLRQLLKATTASSIRALYLLLGYLRWRSRIHKGNLKLVGDGGSDVDPPESRIISRQRVTILPSYDPSTVSQQVGRSAQDLGSITSVSDQNGSAHHTVANGPAETSGDDAEAHESPGAVEVAERQSRTSSAISIPSLPRPPSSNSAVSTPYLPYTPYTGGVHPVLPPPTPLRSRVVWGVPPNPLPRIPRTLVPIPATEIQRYHRKVRIRSSRSRYTIDPGTRRFEGPAPIAGWITCTHPEGALYFYHPEKRIFTDANLFKHKNLDVINACAEQIYDHAKTQGIELTRESELVLEILGERNAKQWQCGYYFVEHETRSLFWAHPYEAEPIFGGVKGVKSASHIKYAVEAQYWMHCELFPNNRAIPQMLFEELKEIIMHATAETITSDTSLAPFDREELAKMLDLMDYLEASAGKRYPHSMCVMARFLRMFARTKFFNFCGQVGARLDADQTVYYKDKRRKSIFLRFLSPLLFGAPDIHTKGLKTIWVDQLVNHIPWKKFIDSLNSEWQEFTLYATVVLNANVAFLAVPGVDLGTGGNESPAQIASYISIVNSVGAVILGLLLVRQNRTKGRESAEEAASFMTRMTQSMFGTETLAILYSLPYALLMWGMVFFVLAFSFLVFDQTHLVTRSTVGTSGAIVALFVFSTIWAAWDNRIPHYWRTFKRDMRSSLATWRKRVRPPNKRGGGSGGQSRASSVDNDSDSAVQSESEGEP